MNPSIVPEKLYTTTIKLMFGKQNYDIQLENKLSNQIVIKKSIKKAASAPNLRCRQISPELCMIQSDVFDQANTDKFGSFNEEIA